MFKKGREEGLFCVSPQEATVWMMEKRKKTGGQPSASSKVMKGDEGELYKRFGQLARGTFKEDLKNGIKKQGGGQIKSLSPKRGFLKNRFLKQKSTENKLTF